MSISYDAYTDKIRPCALLSKIRSIHIRRITYIDELKEKSYGYSKVNHLIYHLDYTENK
jgi:hypothetical protein